MRSWLGVLWLGALAGVACAGTEGTLLVLHESGGSSGASGGSTAAGSAGGQMLEKPYVPAPDVTWQAKLTGAVDIDEDAQLFYLDAELQDPADLATLRAEGRHYLCYLSAGSLEDFRDDAQEFPEQVIGKPLIRFPDERWLDVRAPVVRELMARRIEALARAGCDGVPPSSLAVHAADSGFALTVDDALDYSRWFAERIHAAGMSAGLTGPAELTSELWPTFDFALAISCLEGSRCAEFAVFEQAGKPVLHLELGDEASAAQICKDAEGLGFVPLITSPSFNGESVLCRDIL
jgi:hypothetical protein